MGQMHIQGERRRGSSCGAPWAVQSARVLIQLANLIKIPDAALIVG